jgi:transcription antitermination factor NusG
MGEALSGNGNDAHPQDDPERCWRAIYTRHQHEKVVAELLANKGFDVFLPMYESVRRWKDRAKTVRLPLFTCYAFIRGALDRRFEVLNLPGVIGLVGRPFGSAVIAGAEIESIRRIIAASAPIEPHPPLTEGQRVRVTAGPLEGIGGLLVRRPSECRLVLSLEALGQGAAVHIDASSVEPVVAPSSR